MCYVQIKPDPIAKKEYFTQAFCEVEMPASKARKKEEEDLESNDSEDSDDSDDED